MTYRKDEELASCSRRGCAVGLCSWNRLDLPIKAWSYSMRNETIKNCSFSLRNGEEVASVVAFPRCSQCSQQCLLCHCRGLVGQSVHSVPLPPLSLPSLSRACMSTNTPLLKPRGFTQVFFGYVQLTARLCGQQAAAGPTVCPCASARASRLLTPCHLRQLMAEMLLVAQECGELPVLGPIPGFKKGVCCTGYRLFFICLSPPR